MRHAQRKAVSRATPRGDVSLGLIGPFDDVLLRGIVVHQNFVIGGFDRVIGIDDRNGDAGFLRHQIADRDRRIGGKRRAQKADE